MARWTARTLLTPHLNAVGNEHEWHNGSSDGGKNHKGYDNTQTQDGDGTCNNSDSSESRQPKADSQHDSIRPGTGASFQQPGIAGEGCFIPTVKRSATPKPGEAENPEQLESPQPVHGLVVWSG